MSDLSQLKPGDKAIARRGGHGVMIETVERLTASQIVCKSGIRYLRRGGRRVGSYDTFFCWHLYAATEGDIEEFRKQSRKATLAAQFRNQQWDRLAIEQLEAIDAILRAETQEASAK